MRDRSGCRRARSGVNGSASWDMEIAVCTRVVTWIFSRASCSANAFMTVASMPM
jgi:hypothetical protein